MAVGKKPPQQGAEKTVHPEVEKPDSASEEASPGVTDPVAAGDPQP
jgi:hypothetical protein